MSVEKGVSVKFSTDVLIFSISACESKSIRKLSEKRFSLLLVKRDKEPYLNKWCLPGGFVFEEETSSEASNRVLAKETNLHNVYKEQLYTFDEIDRDPRGRIISTAYMALVDKTKIKEKISSDAEWFNINYSQTANVINVKLEHDNETIEFSVEKILKDKITKQYEYKIIKNDDLSFDHPIIIVMGILNLKQKAENTDILFNFMPNEFTLGELQQIYEVILGKELLEAAFRRTIIKKVKKTDQYIKTGGHRPSVLFKYKNN